jgi:hypothetical protein
LLHANSIIAKTVEILAVKGTAAGMDSANIKGGDEGDNL